MSLPTPFSRRLYLRIWLAVVGGIAVLTLTVGWAWRMAEEQKAQNAQPFVPPSREMLLRGPEGNLVFKGLATRQPSEPGEGTEFRIEADDGRSTTALLLSGEEYAVDVDRDPVVVTRDGDPVAVVGERVERGGGFGVPTDRVAGCPVDLPPFMGYFAGP